MKISYIGTYPPRECGIGTFTHNLIRAIVANSDPADVLMNASVVAINDHDLQYNYPEEVKFTIRQDHQRDYVEAAKFINYSDTRLCILEHEFGIFGGESGVYILPLVYRLEIPLIVTLHTVLKNPSFIQKNILQGLAGKANKIVVMSKRAVKFLKDIYDIPEEKIMIIEHGVPDYDIQPALKMKQKFNFEDRKVLFTFGLLSRNKGIETVINALPKVVEKHPDLLYIVLGSTHPNVMRSSGEEYRNYLNRLVKKNNLGKHVFFNNTFVTQKTLVEYLSAVDIYVTPYLNEAQITSGTLSYAIGSGVAVVSTPYWHAQELLADGRGRLFDFKDSEQLGDILIELLNDPVKLNELKKRAGEYGKHLRWQIIGNEYLKLAEKSVIEFNSVDTEVAKPLIDVSVLPSFNLAHLKRLTDDTGIVQHAKYGIPNLKEGYCLDDNARALLMALMAYRRNKNPVAIELLPIYLSYIQYMQNIKGTFRNFLNFNRHFLDEEGSEDSFGRTVWALGYLIRYSPNDSYFQFALEIFHRSMDNFERLEFIRGVANTLIGVCHYMKKFPEDEAMMEVASKMANRIKKEYRDHCTNDWKWYENNMTYDNAIIPLALYHYAELSGNKEILNIAEESVAFMESITMKQGFLSIVGNEGWFEKGGRPAIYAQQSIDVMAMVMMYYQAYITTRKKEYIERLFMSYMWFLGENELRVPLYDHETAGCNDGLEDDGVNRNQGAESTLAYLISHLTVLQALELEYEYEKK